MISLWSLLRERKLIQWAAAYLAGAWLLLQVVGLLGGFFAWPGTVGRLVTVLLGVGLLAAAPGWNPRLFATSMVPPRGVLSKCVSPQTASQ